MSQQDRIKKEFLLPDLRRDGSNKYLEKIRSVVAKYCQEKIELKKVKDYKFRIGSFKDTSYRDEPDLLEEWEQFYLPDHMKMEVIGFLENFPCHVDSGELVLMVCRDGTVFGYEYEKLHLVANNLKELFEYGIQFPGTQYYYRGQSFEDMTDDDWDKVKKSKEVIQSTTEHQNMLERMKSSYLRNLEALKQQQQGEPEALTTRQRAELFLKKENAFLRNAFIIFNKATEFGNAYLLDKMLHSILFLGNIHPARYSPVDIFAKREIFDATIKAFPRPFNSYRKYVPLQTPFSYFLELIVEFFSESEEKVKAVLSELCQSCKKSGTQYPLISTVICICQASRCSRYYGGSLTCPGEIEREIMTSVSCLHVWHEFVKHAVLGVFPEDTAEPRFRDGTIILPDSVKCRAFDIENLGTVKPPCKRCHELYSLPNPTSNRNKPGNCAETEAISKLLANEEMVANTTRLNGDVLGEEEIKRRMTRNFDKNMDERMAKRRRENQDSYDINRIYV
ncbi:hypothetical protein NFI96_019381 [Prochilodus magdalenae]|nr:hypothetical protein NFI96_019381 [Prochilodus magdalenae]